MESQELVGGMLAHDQFYLIGHQLLLHAAGREAAQGGPCRAVAS